MPLSWVFITLFSSSLLSFSSQAKPSSVTQIRCSVDSFHSYVTLRVDKKPIKFIDFQFDVLGPYLTEGLACRRWLTEIQYDRQLDRILDKVQFRYVYTGNEKKEARFVGVAQKRLYTLCRQSAFCKIAFPYNLYRPFEMLSPKPTSPLPDYCLNQEVSSRPTDKKDAASQESREWKDLDSLKISYSPHTTFADEVIQQQMFDQPITFIGTLTLSSTKLKQIRNLISEKPGHRVFIIFEAGNDIERNSMDDLLALANNQVLLVPQVRHPASNGNFHVKVATSLTLPRVIWTSSNLRSDGATQYVDLNLSFDNQTISQSLTHFLIDRINRSCQHLKYLSCPTTAFSPESADLGHKLHATLHNSCAAFKAHGHIQNLLAAPPANPMFYTNEDTDIKPLLAATIATADESITLLTHQLSSRDVHAALMERASNGVEVSVFADKSKFSLRPPIHYYRQHQKGFHPISHTKAIIFDRTNAFISSGNFTETGLRSNGEMYVFTRDRRIINALGQLGRSLSLQASRGSHFFTRHLFDPATDLSPNTFPKPMIWDRTPKDIEGRDHADVFRAITPEEQSCFARYGRSLFYLEDSAKVLCQSREQ